ncbi:putative muscarinic acetylcholine receptor gar-1 [Trichostrongylus colubriformis]|uniref:Muscarinic acetylcholine receptor gar-1 n=1 Tax=Trichostrongylus colubriformis TaxID=6319 RepID=A0AAN8FKG4_TRICO
MSNDTVADTSWDPPHGILLQVIVWILVIVVSLETIIGNAMVVIAYKIQGSIGRKVSNRYIASLAMSDLIIGVEGFPFFTIYVLNGERWPLGPMACRTWLFLDYTLCLVSILTVLLITADRYLSVCHTASYLKWQTPAKTQILIFLSWLIPAMIFGVMMYGWDAITGIESMTTAECSAPFLSNPYVNMGMYVIYYWTTLVAMLILYKGVHQAAKSLEKKARAKEQRNMALLLGQRLGTQVGVTLMLHSRNDKGPHDCHQRSNSERRNQEMDPETSKPHFSIRLSRSARWKGGEQRVQWKRTKSTKGRNLETANATAPDADQKERAVVDPVVVEKRTSRAKKKVRVERQRSDSGSSCSSVEANRPNHETNRTKQSHLHDSENASTQGNHNLLTPAGVTRKISSFSMAMTRERVISSIFAPISALNRRRKRTNAEKRAHKAFRTITFIVGCFAILWSPYYIMATVYGFCKGECIPTLLYTLSYYMCYLNSSCNPFAYAMANRQFRMAFIRMLKGDFSRTV